jgi:ribosomal-protein-alanine N-acetyltransferase
LFAAELRSDQRFIGFIGLSIPTFKAAFTPCVEIGWRLAADVWGQGLATEGGLAAVRHAFDVIGLEELVSFTACINTKSQRVMQKIGMTRDPAGDFDHPRVPEGHPLRPHVLYRFANPSRAR